MLWKVIRQKVYNSAGTIHIIFNECQSLTEVIQGIIFQKEDNCGALGSGLSDMITACCSCF